MHRLHSNANSLQARVYPTGESSGKEGMGASSGPMVVKGGQNCVAKVFPKI